MSVRGLLRGVSPIAVAAVLTTGAVMGLFAWNTYYSAVPSLYPPVFEQGRWMLSGTSPQGYFRTELHVPNLVNHAWLQVAAQDSFVLYINGRVVDNPQHPGRNVSGLYDVGRDLRPGKNVIGVLSRRITYPGPARVAAEGAYTDASGRERRFGSDGSWKVLDREEFQANGKLGWYALDFRDDQWPAPVLGAVPEARDILPLTVHPLALASPPAGRWIGLADSGARSMLLRGSFTVAGLPRGVWLRIAAEDAYDAKLNGVPVASRTAFRQTLDIYDVTAFVRPGPNVVEVGVAGQAPRSSPRLLLDGLASGAGGVETVLATGHDWEARAAGEASWRAAAVLADYSPARDVLTKTTVDPLPTPLYRGVQTVKMVAWILGFTLAAILGWLASGHLLRRVGTDLRLDEALTADGLLHLPPLVFLGAVYLLSFDSSYDPAFPFQSRFLLAGVGALLGLKAAVLLEAGLRSRRTAAAGHSVLDAGRRGFARRHATVGLLLCLAALVVVGVLLRVTAQRGKSLHHDEVAVATFAEAVLEKGTPTRTIGLLDRPLTTYELLPYPVALSVGLFGKSDLAVRLPAIAFSAAAIALIGLIGARLWNVWTGLLAAAIYTVSPFSLVWGSNAFHPQQAQLCALIASYLFYRAIHTSTPELHARYLYAAAGAFILAYLSWEPTGLLLPAFLVCLLVARGRDLGWLRSRHLWIALVGVGLVVAWQLGRRVLLNVPYIVVGVGLSTEAFKLSWLDPMYEPWFYVEQFLFSGVHTILTLLVAGGLVGMARDRGVRYYGTLLVVLLVLLTNVVPSVTLRYTYFILPFLILPAAAVTIRLAGAVWSARRDGRLRVVRLAGAAVALGAPVLVFLSANTLVARLDRFGSGTEWLLQTLPEVYWVDYRSAQRFVSDRLADGDAVISLMPHTLQYYAGHAGQGYIQTYTDRQIFYDVSEVSGRFLDKYTGSPVLRNLPEVQDALARYRRAWIVATPLRAFETANDRGTLDYIATNSRVVYESYHARVYLWER